MSNPPEAETPTTEDVRDSYTVAWAGWDTTARYDMEAYAEFDRWLAEVKAAAWDECVAVFDAKYFGGPTKDMVLGWLANPHRPAVEDDRG